MAAQFNLDRYNRAELKKTEQIRDLESRIAINRQESELFKKGRGRYPDLDTDINLARLDEKRDELSSKIRILNPLQTLETYSDEAYSSIPRYGNSSVYERKLPLNETDAELIRIVKDSLHCLSDWKFLQVRTEEIDDNAVLSYVLAFQYRGNKDPYSFRKKQSEDNWKNPDFSAEFIVELGLSELGNRLPKDLTDEFKFKGLRVTPGYENGSQGENPYSPNFKFLFIEIKLEDKGIKQMRLDAIADSLDIEASLARRVAEAYRNS